MMQGYPPRLLALCERCPQSMLNRDYWSIKDFVLVKEVGSGAASTVYYAICRKSTQPVAIKMYLKSKLSKLNRRQVEREISIHSSLSHPHIIDFYAAFEDDNRIYLVQEYAAGGDLFDDVKRRGGRLPEQEVVQQILHPYLQALSYLHARGIIHRDIKPENTVFTRERVLKVTDFGLAIAAATERPVTRLGTLDYMAPEVLRCPDKHSPEDNKDRVDLEYDASVDAWAMGVLAYELIVGRPPFGMSCREATMRAIVAASPSIPDWMSPAAADFIRSALQRTPARRLPVDQLLLHPWIVSHVGTAAAAAAAVRSFPAAAPARNLSCGAEAAAAMAAAIAGAASAGACASSAAAASLAAAAGLGPGGSSRSLFFHPGAPYKHLIGQQQGCNSASASELGGSGRGIVVDGGAAAVIAATAALAYGSDQRPAKRQVHRCQSAFLHGPVGGTAAAALAPPGLLAQHHGAPQRLYDTMSYWMTDGNGFSRDPLVGLGGGGGTSAAQKPVAAAVQQQQQQQQAVTAAVIAAAAAAASGGGAASPIGSPMAVGRAQDFYHSQLAQATASSGCGYGTASIQVQQHFEPQQQQLLLQQQQAYQYQQQLQLQQEEEQQRMAVFLQQQQQQQQQHLLLHQQQAAMVEAQRRQQQQQRQDGDSGSGESNGVAAAVSGGAVEPSVPPVTAADYYKLHLEDLRTMWEVGGRTPGNGCRTPAAGPRGMSRSFTARHAAGRTDSSGGAPAVAAAAPSPAAPQSAATSRLLRNNSSSSSGGAMKRRTPDTHDWDLPLLPTAFSAQQLQLQYMPTGRTGGSAAATATGYRPASPLGRSSDAFAGVGGAAAYFTGSAVPAAGAAATMPAGGCPTTPFSPYAAMNAAAMATAGSGGLPPAAALAVPQLTGSLSYTSHGSAGGQRPSRLSKAFRRVDSLDQADGGFGLGFGPGSGSQGSDGSGCSGGGGSLPPALQSARYSGATAAMAALDQLTLASGAGTAAAAAAAVAAAAAAMNSTADSAMAAAAAAAMQVANCMGGARFTAGTGDADADASGGSGSGGGSYNTLSDASNGSSAAACTALTGTSLGGTSGCGSGHVSASACSYDYSAASGGGGGPAAAASPSPNHRGPSLTTCGALYAGQNTAALRLSLPTSLPRLGIPAAGSTTGSHNGGGGAGLRSHPLSSPQVTPWSTPLSSPAASAPGRIPRMHSQPPGVPSFNALLDLMEAEGVLTAEVTTDCGAAAAVAAAVAAVGGSSRSGSLEAPDWGALVMGAGGGGTAVGAATAADGLAAPMQVDEPGAGGSAMPYLFRSVSMAERDLANGIAPTASAPATASAPLPQLPAGAQHMSPEDRWAAAWAATAAASGGGGGAGRISPMSPTTPPSLGRAGSFGLPGAAAGGAVHAPSPLGRDQPHQQARAAAMQQHIRSRSLHRFQLEQFGIAPASGTSGGTAAAAVGPVISPFAASSPPISPRGAGSDAAAAAVIGLDAIATASSSTGGGGGSGGAGGVFGNRLLGGQQLSPPPPPSSFRGHVPYNNNAAAAFPASGGPFRPYSQYGMGAVQCGGGTVASPSPLGLRCSRSRPSNSSSEDTNNVGGDGVTAAAAVPVAHSSDGAYAGLR